jgi:hypothetical protein
VWTRDKIDEDGFRASVSTAVERSNGRDPEIVFEILRRSDLRPVIDL